jgi:hypothetical protein
VVGKQELVGAKAWDNDFGFAIVSHGIPGKSVI